MDVFSAFTPDNLKFFAGRLRSHFKSSLYLDSVQLYSRYADWNLALCQNPCRVAAYVPVGGIDPEPAAHPDYLFFTKFALPSFGIRMSIEWAAITALTVFEAAMISEIVRSGLRSIDKGQIEAARSSGLTYTQTLWEIVLPQALRRMVPPMVSQFISLLKDTSLAVVISLPELMHNAQIVSAKNVNHILPVLALVALMYFIINFLLSRLARKLELKSV